MSEYLDFKVYDWITYHTNTSLGEISIGRWLGVSHKVGHIMYYWVLTVLGHAISCATVQLITDSEINTNKWSQRMREYIIAIEQRLDIKDTDLSKDIAIVEQ